jgi:fructose-bisphosphate aldolase class I
MPNPTQADQIRNGAGFIAALDQSGGSTPKALRLYGVDDAAYSNDAEMYDLIHAMRTRIVMAPAFSGDKVIGAILFEMTMDRQMNGKSAPAFLWDDNRVVPFLKIDKGLEDTSQGCQLMKPMPDLDALLVRAKGLGVFGTKERSVIHSADAAGIAAVVDQQFDIARQVLAHDLVPIIEPEITITAPDKAQVEALLLAALHTHLDTLAPGQDVMLKLTLPEVLNHYAALSKHPRVMRVVALSGGYSRDEANRRLCENTGMIASFSRALTEGLHADQSDTDFNAAIADTIDSIYTASCAG